jgi:YggT family protein
MMLYQVLSIINSILHFYCILIFIWVILSWFKDTKNKTLKDIHKVLDTVVGPYVNLFKKFIPPMGGIDLSPLVALIVLQLAARLIFGLF